MQIINDAVKTSVEPDGKRYIEVHQTLSKTSKDNPQTMAIPLNKQIQIFIHAAETDSQMVADAIVRRSGMPILVSAGQSVEHFQEPALTAPEKHQAVPVSSVNSSY
nr:hypothetical protein [Candidatus Symbiopectobacterium sp.]